MSPLGRTGGGLVRGVSGVRWPDNLPLQLTSFVGREREIGEIGILLESTRALTLTGPGGCGKTRLAMAAAGRYAEDFEGGMGWVWLAPVSDPDLVPEAVAASVGVRDAPGLSPVEAILDHVGDEELLLVMDNCEHVVEACARLADELLRWCPGLRILSTSREALDVAGEVVWFVPPLSRPGSGSRGDPEALAGYEAVRLFVERAGTVAPGFSLTPENAADVARICERLDGMPLALELAASRVKMLSPAQISRRLDDALGLLTGGSRSVPPRQRTLRATLDWSHDLLTEEERVLFRRLGVFVGGFGLGTAEGVCAGEGLPQQEVLPVLSRLVDRSLVLVAERRDESRYRLLATVRQYARERLALSGEEREAGHRHATFFLDLAERAEAGLRGADQEAWLDRLEADLGNFRSAMRWCLDEGAGEDADLGLRLAGALWRFCYLRGYYPQGRAWLEDALASGGSTVRESRAKALTGAGVLALLECEYGRAEERLEEGLALHRELGDPRGEASALQVLGSVARERGMYARSRDYHERSLALWRRLGDDYEAARSLNYLAFVAWLQEEYGRAEELGGEAVATFRRIGDAEGITWALINLGAASLYGGDPAGATPLLEDALSTAVRAGYREGEAWSLNLLGVAAHRAGDPGSAEEALRKSLRVHRELGDRWRIASVFEGLAATAAARRALERAARLLGAAEALRTTLDAPPPPVERQDREEALSAARIALDDGTFERNLSFGRAMGLGESAAEAARGTPDRGPSSDLPHDLSAREVEVLALVAQGLTDAQVARRLSLSPRTVGHHLRSIYRKLRVPSRAAAARAAVELGLI